MNEITDRPDWHEDVWDDDIVDEWRDEVMTRCEDELFDQILGDKKGLVPRLKRTRIISKECFDDVCARAPPPSCIIEKKKKNQG